MGGLFSRAGRGEREGDLDDEECDEIAVETSFTTREVQRLYRIFHAVDADNSGKISEEELMGLPQIHFNPLSKRMVAASFDERRKRLERAAAAMALEVTR